PLGWCYAPRAAVLTRSAKATAWSTLCAGTSAVHSNPGPVMVRVLAPMRPAALTAASADPPSTPTAVAALRDLLRRSSPTVAVTPDRGLVVVPRLMLPGPSTNLPKVFSSVGAPSRASWLVRARRAAALRRRAHSLRSAALEVSHLPKPTLNVSSNVGLSPSTGTRNITAPSEVCAVVAPTMAAACKGCRSDDRPRDGDGPHS